MEFEKAEHVRNVLKESSYVENNQAVPVHSPFLWFKASHKRLTKLKEVKSATIITENGTYILKDFEISEALKKATSVSAVV